MADPNIAFLFTMHNEDSTLSGVVSPEPNGGKARFGVNSVAHPEALTDGFYEMSKPAAWAYAFKIYLIDYWHPVQGDNIVNQLLANKIADLSYDLNAKPMVKIVQRAANSVIGNLELTVDGVMGPKTLAQVNGLDSVALYSAIKSYAKEYYQDIVRAHPEYEKYLQGWLNRVDA